MYYMVDSNNNKYYDVTTYDIIGQSQNFKQNKKISIFSV